jgi:hypothetical protein
MTATLSSLFPIFGSAVGVFACCAAVAVAAWLRGFFTIVFSVTATLPRFCELFEREVAGPRAGPGVCARLRFMFATFFARLFERHVTGPGAGPGVRARFGFVFAAFFAGFSVLSMSAALSRFFWLRICRRLLCTVGRVLGGIGWVLGRFGCSFFWSFGCFGSLLFLA